MKIIARTPRLILPAYIVPTGTIAAYIDTIGAVAHWRMGDALGSTILVDRIAGEQAPLIGGSDAYDLGSPGLVFGDADTAVLFKGGIANSGADAKWSLGTGDFSIFLIAQWVGASFQTVMGIRDGGSNIMTLFTINRTAAGQVGVESWNWSTQKLLANGTYNDGAPHALGVTYDAATNTMRFYVDGALVVTQVQSGSLSRPTAATMSVRMANNDSSQIFAGTLDEIAMFSKRLTDTQMADLANIVHNGHI